mmetsp:Transcript_21344/g.56190  ORF Transcript_21344/g.56190 Transcript_21344/m.56190 type:complete len:346 (+) Transcript_21344:580-1617(+)
MNRAVRTDDGGAGFMVGAGLHFSYAGLVEAFKARDGKRSHDDWSTAASMLHMAAKSFVALFSGAGCGWEAFAQQRAAARFGGLPACADASHNLANPVHLDVGDGDRSFAIWTRGQPQLGEIVGHYLLFPHVGLAIELVDGVAVSWDGRVLAHCTSEPATAVRADDALFSLFFSLPIDVLVAQKRMAEMRDALRAQAASDTYPPWSQGAQVWAKWYPWVSDAQRRGSDRWYRATGILASVATDGTVVVDWVGEAGRGRSTNRLTAAQAGQMLVRAGRVTPYTRDTPHGDELVGRRVLVYWDAMDALYTAQVIEYDAGTGEHHVRYVDGSCAWEGFGTEYTSEVNVL